MMFKNTGGNTGIFFLGLIFLQNCTLSAYFRNKVAVVMLIGSHFKIDDHYTNIDQ